jgi:hypothetical protein
MMGGLPWPLQRGHLMSRGGTVRGKKRNDPVE